MTTATRTRKYALSFPRTFDSPDTVLRIHVMDPALYKRSTTDRKWSWFSETQAIVKEYTLDVEGLSDDALCDTWERVSAELVASHPGCDFVYL